MMAGSVVRNMFRQICHPPHTEEGQGVFCLRKADNKLGVRSREASSSARPRFPPHRNSPSQCGLRKVWISLRKADASWSPWRGTRCGSNAPTKSVADAGTTNDINSTSDANGKALPGEWLARCSQPGNGCGPLRQATNVYTTCSTAAALPCEACMGKLDGQ